MRSTPIVLERRLLSVPIHTTTRALIIGVVFVIAGSFGAGALSAEPRYGGHYRTWGCSPETAGKRIRSTNIWNVPGGWSLQQACAALGPQTVAGEYFAKPTRCVNRGTWYAEFDINAPECGPKLGDFRNWGCSPDTPGKRIRSANIYDVPGGWGFNKTCDSFGPRTVAGEYFEKPTRCVNRGTWYAEYDITDAACNLNMRWNKSISEGRCTNGYREHWARLWDTGSLGWEIACERWAPPISINGKYFAHPSRCDRKVEGMYGVWLVKDSQCESQPRGYARGDEDELHYQTPLSGYADLHTHPMAYVGQGGLVSHGLPYGPPHEALADCPSGTGHEVHNHPHTRLEQLVGSDFAQQIAGALGIGDHYNQRRGWPHFDWPRYNSYTHQAMYWEWIKRSYEGGMRVMVVLAINGREVFGDTRHSILGGISLPGPARESDAIFPLNDHGVLRMQSNEVEKMKQYLDSIDEGDWFVVARTPAEARQAVEEGRLAVIVGSEVDYLFDCEELYACSKEEIRTRVDEIEALGISYIFPIHLKTNAFGGAAMYNELGYGQTFDCHEYQKDCNVLGLTEEGEFLMRELMSRGFIIDVGHMSARATEAALQLAEELDYPGIAHGHTGVHSLAKDDHRHEGNMRDLDFKRILKLGGMIGLIANQGQRYNLGEWRGTLPGRENDEYIPHACGTTSNSWLQSYLHMLELTHAFDSETDGDQHPARGQLAIGTDFNGFIKMPGPRFGNEACPGGKSQISQPASSKVSYPFSADPALRPVAATGDGFFDTFMSLFTGGSGTSGRLFELYSYGTRIFDFNTMGLAHVGLMPEFFEDLRQQGLRRSELEPIMRSAGYFVEMWENAKTRSQNIPAPPL